MYPREVRAITRVGSIKTTGIQKVRSLRRAPLIPLFLLTLMVLTGVLSPWIAPHNSTEISLAETNIPPIWMADGNGKYILGTDQLGRDMLSRIIEGARVSLVVAAVAIGIGGGVGTVLGLLSGYLGGWVDEIIMRLVDVTFALPLLLMALVVVLTFGQSFVVLIALLALWLWARFARMVRGEVLKLKEMDYVALAHVAGASTTRILVRHILPGITSTLIIVATVEVGGVILLEATLSFLGAGAPPPTPTWGSMVANGRARLATAWWISALPGISILLTVMSLNMVGDWLRDTLDPKLRQLG